MLVTLELNLMQKYLKLVTVIVNINIQVCINSLYSFFYFWKDLFIDGLICIMMLSLLMDVTSLK